MTTLPVNSRHQARDMRGCAATLLHRAGKMAARAAWRVVCVGNPLTPGGYAILAITIIAITLILTVSASSVSNDLEPALRQSGLFS
jgi:hypothetical protein